MPAALWIPLALAAIGVFSFGVSVGIKFDLNAYLKDRRDTQYARVQAMCPHAVLDPTEDRRVAVRGLCQKPPMAFQAQCTRCHRVFPGGLDETREQLRYWRDNPKELIKAEERFRRYAKASGSWSPRPRFDQL